MMQVAIKDLHAGLKAWPVWWELAKFDVVSRFRRTILGPFWNTMTTGIFIGFMTLVYSRVLGVDVNVYIPHLTVGYVIWIMFSNVVTESVRTFTDNEGIITQSALPLSLHVFRLITRQILIFFHNSIIFIPLFLYFGAPSLIELFAAIAGLLIFVLNAIWVSVTLAIIGTRFRDVQPLINSLMQLAFFVTPVIWVTSRLGESHFVNMVNPFFHFMELLRQPLLGGVPSSFTVMYVLAATVVGWLLMLRTYGKLRNHIVFWL